MVKASILTPAANAQVTQAARAAVSTPTPAAVTPAAVTPAAVTLAQVVAKASPPAATATPRPVGRPRGPRRVNAPPTVTAAPVAVAARSAPVAAKVPPVAAKPAPKPKPDTSKVEYEAGRNLALTGAPCLPDNASEHAIRGWNEVIDAGQYNTQKDVQASPFNQAPIEVETIIEAVPTPVADVQIETQTTVAAPIEQTLPEDTGPTDPTENTSTSQALVVQPKMEVGAVGSYAGSGFEGDWDVNDLKFPQLKLVQGSGQLSAIFNDGTLIYGESELFAPLSVKPDAKNPTLRFVPIGIRKQWRENLEEEAAKAGEMPRVVDTVAELEELGGTVQWIGNQKPSWGPSARCIFLIEQPTIEPGASHPGFATALDGKMFSVAVYYAASTAFGTSAKVIFNTSHTSLLAPALDSEGKPQLDAKGRILKHPMMWKNFWTLGFFRKTFKNGFQAWVPNVYLLSKEETGPEVRDYCANLLSQGAVVEDAAKGE